MVLIKHELKQNGKAFLLWTGAISFFLLICIFIFPEMKNEMEDVNAIFSSMGAFTEAFGMDRLNFGTLIGFYTVECGNILGLGGAFFAALTGAAALCKEERNRTAEFLLTLPIKRTQVLLYKLLSVWILVLGLNLIVFGFAVGAIWMIGESIPWKELFLLHLANTFLQIQLACICFGISAFLRKGSAGMGMALAAALYFFNIISNITQEVSFLRYITPFAYTEGADILENGHLDAPLLLLGLFYAVFCTALGFWQYNRKDIQ